MKFEAWLSLRLAIEKTLKKAQKELKHYPTRELALVVTKLEEAKLWSGTITDLVPPPGAEIEAPEAMGNG